MSFNLRVPLFLFVCLSVVTMRAADASEGDKVTMVTGLKTGTYYAFAHNIMDAAKKADIDIAVKPSEGSIDNIKRLNGKEKVDLGFVQSDVLGFLRRSKNPNSVTMASNIRMVFPLYSEEVHVLASKKIRSFKDLQGKKVAIGEDGSGNMLTAINLFSIANIKPAESKKISSAKGVVEVLKGKIDAVIFVGGKPVRLFKNLEDLELPENKKYKHMLSRVHFVPMTGVKMLEEYEPAEILPGDYSFVTKAVPTVSVKSVLVSYDFSQGKDNLRNCKKLANFSQFLRYSLSSLKKNGHPKWKDVDFDTNTNIWDRDNCVWSSPGRL